MIKVTVFSPYRLEVRTLDKSYKGWVVTIFWVAHTHLARPDVDVGQHVNVSTPPT